MELIFENLTEYSAFFIDEDWKKKALALIAAGAIATGVMVKNKGVSANYVAYEKQETQIVQVLRTMDIEKYEQYKQLKMAAEQSLGKDPSQLKITSEKNPEAVKQFQQFRLEVMKSNGIK